MLELKLDKATMFEQQRHSQDSKNTLHYSALLDFIDLRAEAFKNAILELDLKCRTPSAKKKCYPQIPLYTVSVDDLCMAWKLGRHPHMLVWKLNVYHLNKW